MKFRVIGVTLVCFSLIFVGLTGQSTAAIDPNTIVGLWLFDGSSGDTAKDSSGNGLDGVFVDGPERINGAFGKALQFDGVASHLMIPDHANPTEAITVTAWAKSDTETWNQNGWILEKRDAFMLHNTEATQNVGWIMCNGGCWNLPFTWEDGAVGPDDITEWHMYTGTFDSATGEWYLYIDGELESEMELDKAPLAEDVGPMYVGRDT